MANYKRKYTLSNTKPLGIDSFSVKEYKNFLKNPKKFKIDHSIPDNKDGDINAYKLLLRQLLEEFTSDTYSNDRIIPQYIGSCLAKLGDLEKKSKSLDTAKMIFEELLDEYQKNNNSIKRPNKNIDYVHYEFGKLLVYMGKLEMAEKEFLECINLEYRQKIYAIYELGKVYFRQSRYEEAIPLFRQYEERYHDNIHVHFYLAKALKNIGESEEEIEEHLRIYLENKTSVDIYALCDLGECLRIQGKLEEAQNEIEKCLKLRPNDIYANYEMASIFRDLNKIEDSMHHFNIVIEQANNNNTIKQRRTRKRGIEKKLMNAYYELGKLQRRIGKLKEAEKSIMNSLRIGKAKDGGKRNKLSSIYFELGLIYRDQKENDLSMENFELALNEFKKNEDEKNEDEKNEDEKNEDERNKDRKINDKYTEMFMRTYYEIAKLHRKSGDFNKAEEYVNTALNICEEKKSAFLHIELGMIYSKMFESEKREIGGENNSEYFKKAEDEFLRSIEIETEPIKFGYIQLALLYKMSGDFKKATEFLQIFNEENEKNGNKYSEGYKELALLQKEKWPEYQIMNLAIDPLKKWAEIDESLPVPHLYLGEIYWNQSELKEAEKEFLTCIKLDDKEKKYIIAYFELGLVESSLFGDTEAKELYYALIRATNGTRTVPEQIKKQFKNDESADYCRVYNQDSVMNTLNGVKSSLDNGNYQYFEGYSCDFYIVRADGCGFLGGKEGNEEILNFIAVCTIPKSDKIISMIPISGVKEIGKQIEYVKITPANIKDVVSRENNDLSTETIKTRRNIANTIGKYIEKLNNLIGV